MAKIRPLDKALWAGGVDNLGGDTLAWMLSTMQQSATVASIGLAADHAWKASVMPFTARLKMAWPSKSHDVSPKVTFWPA